MRCGLLGRKLGHSYSPQIHKHLGSYSYDLLEKEPEELENFFKNLSYDGLNVTIPYKKSVIPFCNSLSPVAKELGAVNTIVKTKDGKIVGHNTDYFGFLSMLKHADLDVANKKVLVLGSGGASVTVMAVLKKLGANAVQISRKGENNYSNLHLHRNASVIVNATPVGMYPDTGVSPVELDIFPNLEGVLDLIYNPAQTKLLLDAEQRGIKCENGLWMLVAQAKESAEWFTRLQISDSVINRIHNALSFQMKNIILIGMPGSGKSTIGRLLAEKTGRTFIDADNEIEAAAKMSIPEFFRLYGEPDFRKLETQVLKQIGQRSGCVIATGGGCVTKPENYAPLHQNGIIIWIQRNLELLPTEGRPVSQSNSTQQLYKIRRPLYAAFSDKHIINDQTPENAVSAVLSALQEVLS